MDFEQLSFASFPILKFEIGDNNTSDEIVSQSGYYEPGMGSGIEFDDDFYDKLIENFNQKVGIATAVPLFYTHFRFGDVGKAAAWVNRLSKRVDQETGKTQLVATFEWTDPGKLAINKKEYRYFSIEVYKNYIKTLRDGSEIEFGPVLSGIALTNEPAVTDLPGIFGKNPLAALAFKNKNNEDIGKESSNMNKLFALFGVTTEAEALEAAKKLTAELAQAKENYSSFKQEADSKIEGLNKDLEKERTDFAKYKADSFKVEKENFLNSLFDSQRITKETMDKALEYNADQFSVFRDIHSQEDKENSNSPLRKPVGNGNEPKNAPNEFSNRFKDGDKDKKLKLSDIFGQ